MTAVTAMTATVSPAGAAAELRTALREAGLHIGATGADDHVQLSPLKASDARQLARLIRTGTKRTLKAARALREICEAYGVGLPEMRVRQGRITLGACRIDDAFRLARLLGASSPGRTHPMPTYLMPMPYGNCWRRPSPLPREAGLSTSPYVRRLRMWWSWGPSTLVRPGG
ncbi:hypothetical protein [Streptomyces arboris]|uniref:hypothetical protein n=1 Tax=Streptomyces arboris TaxID=2600619 RepID=UPI003C2F9DCB